MTDIAPDRNKNYLYLYYVNIASHYDILGSGDSLVGIPIGYRLNDRRIGV
jgi:hypothetical protein